MSEDRARVITVTHSMEATENLLLKKVSEVGNVQDASVAQASDKDADDMDTDQATSEDSTDIGCIPVIQAMLQNAHVQNSMTPLQELLDEWLNLPQEQRAWTKLRRVTVNNFKNKLAECRASMVTAYSEKDFNNVRKVWPSETV